MIRLRQPSNNIDISRKINALKKDRLKPARDFAKDIIQPAKQDNTSVAPDPVSKTVQAPASYVSTGVSQKADELADAVGDYLNQGYDWFKNIVGVDQEPSSGSSGSGWYSGDQNGTNEQQQKQNNYPLLAGLALFAGAVWYFVFSK